MSSVITEVSTSRKTNDNATPSGNWLNSL
jgi:hypothetical protein